MRTLACYWQPLRTSSLAVGYAVRGELCRSIVCPLLAYLFYSSCRFAPHTAFSRESDESDPVAYGPKSKQNTSFL